MHTTNQFRKINVLLHNYTACVENDPVHVHIQRRPCRTVEALVSYHLRNLKIKVIQTSNFTSGKPNFNIVWYMISSVSELVTSGALVFGSTLPTY